jgi:hypothetical protein
MNEQPGSFVVKCYNLGDMSRFQSPGIACQQSYVHWNLHMQLLVSPQTDLSVEKLVFHRRTAPL